MKGNRSLPLPVLLAVSDLIHLPVLRLALSFNVFVFNDLSLVLLFSGVVNMLVTIVLAWSSPRLKQTAVLSFFLAPVINTILLGTISTRFYLFGERPGWLIF